MEHSFAILLYCRLLVLLSLNVLILQVFSVSSIEGAFVPRTRLNRQVQNLGRPSNNVVVAWEMKRPLLDQIATTLFQLETNRVKQSSVVDDQGRIGEPMEWSEDSSMANQFSKIMAQNPVGYAFKQWIADIVAGDFDEEAITSMVENYIDQTDVVMFSFSTCPFCRRAKDILDERGVKYLVVELDELKEGNEMRAILSRKTKRTSMPNIFVKGKCIGGCNDGYPGLVPLIQSGEFDTLLAQ
jgi:glutaredoxin 3